MHYITITVAAVLLVAIAIFSIQNLAAVDVAFLFWSFTLSKTIVILGTYLLGMVSGWGVVEFLKTAFKNS